VPVYFIRCPSLYDRPSIYGNGDDEHLRFGVLSWAALKLCQYLQFAPDVVHCNDWQTGIVPLLLKSLFAWDRLFADTRSVLTIHNLGHQGTFGAHAAHEVGLGHCIDQVHQDELHAGRFGFMLTGLLHAHALTTVSPTYAREIQTQDHGVGLDPFLRARRESLFGILNGIDDTEWNPEVDTHLPARYSAGDLSGKARCKEALCHTMHLPYMPDVPVVGIVSGSCGRRASTSAWTSCPICCATGACSSWCSARASIGTRRSSTTWRARSRSRSVITPRSASPRRISSRPAAICS
jgi:starch synthase